MLNIMNHLGMEDYQLLENKILHSRNRYLISFLMLYYVYIKVPYNVQYPHNFQIVSCLLNHYQLLLYLVFLNLLQFRNLLVLFYFKHLEEYFMVSNLYGQFDKHYAE
jgi:hypothetical protein